MPEVTVQHIHRSRGGADERDKIVGKIRAAGRHGSLPAGTFKLKTLSMMHIGEPDAIGSKHIGSVNNPNTIGNTVQLIPVSTGTANAGSLVPNGTIESTFTAYGY